MQPIGKYVLVKLIDEEVKTDSGLLLTAQDVNDFRYHKAQVVKPGTDVSVIKEGDIIFYDKGHGYTMVINQEHLTVIQERDVVVVL